MEKVKKKSAFDYNRSGRKRRNLLGGGAAAAGIKQLGQKSPQQTAECFADPEPGGTEARAEQTAYDKTDVGADEDKEFFIPFLRGQGEARCYLHDGISRFAHG